MELEVKLQVFEGPLDLLLHLIEKNKVDIYDIPIVEITEQYLDYVSKMPKDDLDLASEFLVMAATLIDIKSKMLLQVHDELIFNVYDDEIDKVKEIVYNTMTNVFDLKVPLDVDIELGNNWYEAK